MSVVIKELEMPKSCLNCYFAERFPHDLYESVYCALTTEDVSECTRNRKRGNDCPLIDGVEMNGLEIICCKDCKNSSKHFNHENEDYYICDYWDGCTEGNDFCSNAERRMR